jgi:hypothetical protein
LTLNQPDAQTNAMYRSIMHSSCNSYFLHFLPVLALLSCRVLLNCADKPATLSELLSAAGAAGAAAGTVAESCFEAGHQELRRENVVINTPQARVCISAALVQLEQHGRASSQWAKTKEPTTPRRLYNFNLRLNFVILKILDRVCLFGAMTGADRE